MNHFEPFTHIETPQKIDYSIIMDQKILKELQEIKKTLHTVVTKNDVKQFITKDDVEQLVTKDDVKQFLTKDDAKQFLTKEDARNFATKDNLRKELSNYATKDDLDEKLNKHSEKICEDLGEVISTLFTKTDELKADRTDLEAIEARVDKIEQKLVH